MPRRNLAILAVVAGLLLATLSLWQLAGDGDAEPGPVSRPATVAGTTGSSPPLSSPPATAKAKPSAKGSKPTRITIPKIGVDTRVIPISMTSDRVLLPPRSTQILGWWDESARAGASEGTTVLTGHTVHTGGGVLDDTDKLRKGDAITLETAKGAVEYRVDRVVTYSKAELPAHSEEVFGQEGPGRLVVVTCENWNGEAYDDNVVAFASPK